ncbi:DMT family transporter [Anaeromicropila herbilytica]|uniref:Membrane protein n=1 Tax=Anaeromicropila herbilytica TaxID=2785025 RepID=A0A7R7IBC9_9FIRM|nr:DMT family transporter [Anaeromicropila herbilytica]BCN29452.1 membrane protein [Anaeromicropila herbilytica]
MLFIYLLAAAGSGITIVLARIINSKLAEKIGTLQGTLINYIVGLIVSILCFFVSKESSLITISRYHSVPIWAYFGGIVGVITILSSNYITPRISSFYLTLLIFIGQLFVGIAIDYFILQELSLGKLIGGIFVVLGLSYILWVDKKEALE